MPVHARKVAQIADSRRHLRKSSGVLIHRRTSKKNRGRKVSSNGEVRHSQTRPLFLVFLFLVTQYFFFGSPLFQVRDVIVNSSPRVSEKEIRSRLSLSDSSSTWAVSKSSIEMDLTGHPLLKDAQIDVVFPGRVTVSVSERKPRFYAAYHGTTEVWYSVDEEGVVFESVKPLKNQVKFLLSRPLKVGSRLSPSELEIIDYFQKELSPKLGQRFRDVKITKSLDLAIKLSFQNRDIWVRLGRPERMTYKLFLLEKLLAQLAPQTEQIESIDLRFSAPLVKILKTASSQEPLSL